MLEKVPIAFLAGLLSVITPCVLPLVPGYLSAISAVEVDRLGERGVGRRIVVASLPFILGFTVVFVAARRRRGGGREHGRQADAAEDRRVRARRDRARVHRPPAVAGARGRARAPAARAAARLEGAARRRVRRVRGAVHRHGARVDPRARVRLDDRSRAASSCSSPTRSASARRSCSPGIAFAHAMRAFRWVRDHYAVVRVVSGATLVALGLLLFFNRDWWLRIALDQMLTRVGLSTV